jgi:hypothetical protein
LTSFEKYNKLTIANVYTTFLENLVAIWRYSLHSK